MPRGNLERARRTVRRMVVVVVVMNDQGQVLAGERSSRRPASRLSAPARPATVCTAAISPYDPAARWQALRARGAAPAPTASIATGWPLAAPPPALATTRSAGRFRCALRIALATCPADLRRRRRREQRLVELAPLEVARLGQRWVRVVLPDAAAELGARPWRRVERAGYWAGDVAGERGAGRSLV